MQTLSMVGVSIYASNIEAGVPIMTTGKSTQRSALGALIFDLHDMQEVFNRRWLNQVNDDFLILRARLGATTPP